MPISGLEGLNLIEKYTDPNLTSWWKGESLMEMLDKVKVPTRTVNKPLRLTVMDYTSRTQGAMIGDCV